MKTCQCGNQFEPIGHRGICLECKRAYDKEWRLKAKSIGMTVRGETSEEWLKQYYQRPEVKARRARAMRKYLKQDHVRLKSEARRKVRTALKNGSLIKKPCFCGIEKVESHHQDYSKPLEVSWLCRNHHRTIHAQAEEKS